MGLSSTYLAQPIALVHMRSSLNLFLFFFIIVFIYIPILGCAGSSLLHWLSLVVALGDSVASLVVEHGL